MLHTPFEYLKTSGCLAVIGVVCISCAFRLRRQDPWQQWQQNAERVSGSPLRGARLCNSISCECDNSSSLVTLRLSLVRRWDTRPCAECSLNVLYIPFSTVPPYKSF